MTILKQTFYEFYIFFSIFFCKPCLADIARLLSCIVSCCLPQGLLCPSICPPQNILQHENRLATFNKEFLALKVGEFVDGIWWLIRDVLSGDYMD